MSNEFGLAKGDALVREGAFSNSLFLLKEGTLEIKKRHGGKEISLGHIQAGELVGEISFLTQEPRSATIVAATNCVIVEIPSEVFNKILKGLPPWFQSLIKNLALRLRKTSSKINT